MLPILVLAALFGGWRLYANRAPGVWTAERAAVYGAVLRTERNPLRLAHWADWFQKEGFPERAQAIRARAAIPTAHGEAQSEVAGVVRRALASRNPGAVRRVADALERTGRGSSAGVLRAWARGLEVSGEVPRALPLEERYPAFGLGTVIPSTYAPPAPPPPPPPDPSQDSSADAPPPIADPTLAPDAGWDRAPRFDPTSYGAFPEYAIDHSRGQPTVHMSGRGAWVWGRERRWEFQPAEGAS
jgi:hypothetical protein